MATTTLPTFVIETENSSYEIVLEMNGPLKNNRFTFSNSDGFIKLAVEDHPEDENLKIITCPKISNSKGIAVRTRKGKNGQFKPAATVFPVLQALYKKQLELMEQASEE